MVVSFGNRKCDKAGDSDEHLLNGDSALREGSRRKGLIEKTIETKTYSFGPKEFKTDLDSSLKREKARRIVQSKYMNDQMNRSMERTVVEQRVSPNYQTKTVSYGPPPTTSFRSSNLESFKKKPVDTFENIVSRHAQPKQIAKKRAAKGEADKKGDKPNTIEFSNKNGPETFTITHKT